MFSNQNYVKEASKYNPPKEEKVLGAIRNVDYLILLQYSAGKLFLNLNRCFVSPHAVHHILTCPAKYREALKLGKSTDLYCS